MCLIQNPGVQVREMESETILLDKETGYVHHLNTTASALWADFDGRKQTERIVEEFIDRVDTEASRARDDAMALIEDLTSRRLLLPRQATGIKSG